MFLLPVRTRDLPAGLLSTISSTAVRLADIMAWREAEQGGNLPCQGMHTRGEARRELALTLLLEDKNGSRGAEEVHRCGPFTMSQDLQP